MTFSWNQKVKLVEITRITLPFERLPNAFHGIKLLQFSDIHIGHHFDLQDLERVVKLIQKEKADILCFTGDLFDADISEAPDLTSQLLGSLEAHLGKWAVLGNHDKWIGTTTLSRSCITVVFNLSLTLFKRSPIKDKPYKSQALRTC